MHVAAGNQRRDQSFKVERIVLGEGKAPPSMSSANRGRKFHAVGSTRGLKSTLIQYQLHADSQELSSLTSHIRDRKANIQLWCWWAASQDHKEDENIDQTATNNSTMIAFYLGTNSKVLGPLHGPCGTLPQLEQKQPLEI